MNTLRTQRKPLLCLSLSNSHIKIFEKKQACLRNFFVSRFAFLFVKLIETDTVCLVCTVILPSEIKQLSEELSLYKAYPEKPVIE